MTLVHYWQWFCSVKLGFTDVFSLCRDVWNGDRKGMSLVSRHMRGNSPVNGSFLWHFFVPPQWVHVQTIKEVFGSFPSEMYPTTPFVTKWCICLFPFVYFYLEGRPCQWSCSFLENLLPVCDVLSVLQLFGIACNITTECNIGIAYHVFIWCQMTLFYTLLHPKL